MGRLWLLGMPLLLLCCGRDPIARGPVRTPRGTWGYTVECVDLADCYSLASQCCPGGYVVYEPPHRFEKRVPALIECVYR